MADGSSFFGNGPVYTSPAKPVRQSLPMNLPPRGLSRIQAAAYIGVGCSKFDDMIREGVMPSPRISGRRRLWDRLEIDKAFENLPHAGGQACLEEGDTPGEESNPWDEVKL